MKFYIKKKKVEKINKLRIYRTLSNSSKSFKLVYKLIPILFNYNDPNLPGFIDFSVPSGVCFFFQVFNRFVF